MPNQLYTLEVFIIEGPVTEEFARANPVMSRTIEIQGRQTLEQLHAAIFEAFDRREQHPYEFHLGEDPDDLERVRYGLPSSGETPLLMSVSLDPDFGLSVVDEPTGDVAETTIADLELTPGRLFGYWFDFGDHWYHKINVVAIGEAEPRVEYPRVVARVGESPPQYMDWDEEE